MRIWAIFLGGPVIWLAHFMLVYLLLEAGCAAVDEPVLSVLGLSALSLFVLAATAVAAAAALFIAVRGYGRWHAGRGADDGGHLAFAGFLLASLFFVAVLFVGLPAIWLKPC